MINNEMKIKYIKEKRSSYFYDINGIIINIKKKLEVDELENLVKYVYENLINFTGFRYHELTIPLRDFMLIGYLFFSKELSEYLLSFMEELILKTSSKKISEIVVLKYVFNVGMTPIQYTIHNSTDVSELGYNEKIKEFIGYQIREGKKAFLKKILINKDIEKLSDRIKLFPVNYLFNIFGTELLNEAVEYFDYIIREIHIPQNKILSLNNILATGTGLKNKSVKDNKNLVWTPEKENLYREINRLIQNYEQDFVLSKKERECLEFIEDALINFKKLNGGELSELAPSRVLKISMEKYSDKFDLYIKKICDDLICENIMINRALIMTKIFDGISMKKGNHIYTHYKMNSNNINMEQIIVGKIKEQVDKVKLYNYKFDEDIWILREKLKEAVYKHTINFSSLQESIIKNEIKSYYDFQIKKLDKNMSDTDGFPKNITNISLVIESIRYLIDNLNIKASYEIERIHIHKLIKYYQNEYRTKQNKKIKASTIESSIVILKSFIYWLMENNIKGVPKPKANEFESVTMRGVVNENTKIIPEVVIEEILLHLDELDINIQRILLIMINCGLRFKEVQFLFDDCVSESNDNVKILKYIPYKVLESRRRNGLDDYHRIVIDNEIYLEIIKQINYSSELRKEYSTNEIFLKKTNNNLLHLISNVTFCKEVQKVINKFNIKDENGDVWKISSKQCRKTLAVDMITKGNAKPREVSDYLGHLNENTTEKYYNDVRKLKLADMNSEFFKKKFELILSDKELEKFSEEERKSLYVDFCLNAREVEFGVCTKNFSTEPCELRGDIWGCVSCAKICTGKKYLNRWIEVFNEQKKLVENLKDVYVKESIPEDEYINFREFQRESSLMKLLKESIDKIEGWD